MRLQSLQNIDFGANVQFQLVTTTFRSPPPFLFPSPKKASHNTDTVPEQQKSVLFLLDEFQREALARLQMPSDNHL